MAFGVPPSNRSNHTSCSTHARENEDVGMPGVGHFLPNDGYMPMPCMFIFFQLEKHPFRRAAEAS